MKWLHHWALVMSASLPLSAHAFSLQWPADCTDGERCFVQNYADHDPSSAARDFTCGGLTYDTHDGTDIRLRSLAAMRAGVAVLAPADGTVLRVRDGVAEQSIRGASDTPVEVARNIAGLEGKECGNGVVIQHGEGYQTMLCHMRRGSIRVRPGQAVKAGDAVGMIGLSGNTEFPHVHLTVWHDDVMVDPYSAAPVSAACGASEAGNLWATAHPYRATVLLGDGFTSDVPDKQAMRDAPVSLATLDTKAPALSYWVDIMGTRAGDVLSLRIAAPDGMTLVENTRTLPKSSAVYFGFIGKRNRGVLTAGRYTARVTLVRAGETVVEMTRVLAIQ